MKQYVVQPGECLISIAEQHGFLWESLWALPENAALKSQRKDPFALFPGDVVAIPDARPKEASIATDARHVFRRKGSPAKLSIRIMENGEPRASAPYLLMVDSEPQRSGVTAADGSINERISPVARRALLVVGQGEDAVEYELEFGRIDPIDEASGVQGRLHDLGFFAGAIDDVAGPDLEAATRMFQARHGLGVTGRLDGATLAAIEKEYGG
jgi:hypothetical protein